MHKFYERFSEQDRREIRKWQLRVTASYLVCFVVLLSFVLANHKVGDWTSHTTQAELTNSTATTLPAIRVSQPRP
jgi:hypothetical protein